MIAFNYLFEVLSYIKSEEIKLLRNKNFCRLLILKGFQAFKSLTFYIKTFLL